VGHFSFNQGVAQSLLMALPTSSICVVIFGVILAFALDDLFNILSGSAAYAAVLVVFFWD
jgi:hypothetical protein